MRPDKLVVIYGLSGCRPSNADWRAAMALARLGGAALPDLEKELDSIEKNPQGFGTNWLLLAYARIRGPAAFPRLRRISGGSAVALSLALTSNVSLMVSSAGVSVAGAARSLEMLWIR